MEENVIGIIEIETIDIRLPIMERTSDGDIAYAIGHMSETFPSAQLETACLQVITEAEMVCFSQT